MTTQQITRADPLFSRLRNESTEVSFRSLCPEVPNTTYLTHGIHAYPAKFIPQIPRYFIKSATQLGDTILDPFAGSGTALVEATLLGRHSVGGDVNPLSPKLWKVKTYFDEEITSWGFVLPQFFRHLKETKPPTPPDVPNLEVWFDEEPRNELSRIFEAIRTFDGPSENFRDFLTVSASSTVRKVSRADPKIGKPFVSKRMREMFSRGPVVWNTRSVFMNQVERYFARLGEFQRAMKMTVAQTGLRPRVNCLFPQDARTMEELRTHSIDGAVTSPPYVSAQEYFRTVKLELFWLREADGQSINDLERQILGTEKTPPGESKEFCELGVDVLDRGLQRVHAIDQQRWRVAFDYFLGLRKHFRRMSQVLRPQARYGFLIGDNTIRRVPLPVHLGVIALAEDAGLRCEGKVYDRIVSRALAPSRNNSAGLIDVEWFLTFVPN